jgi:hypothetical protein
MPFVCFAPQLSKKQLKTKTINHATFNLHVNVVESPPSVSSTSPDVFHRICQTRSTQRKPASTSSVTTKEVEGTMRKTQ